jgi:excisionase family DNA binding protein
MANGNRLAYSPQEAADALGLCLNTVYNLIHNGKLPYVKINRRLLIPRADLEALLKDGQSCNPPSGRVSA